MCQFKHAWALMACLVVEAAEDDCESLLSLQSRKLTSGTIQYTTDGLCIPKKKGENVSDVSVAVRDNHLDFIGFAGATLHSVHFNATWWSITPGQPIEKRCVIDDEGDKPNRVKVLCGRYSSTMVADDFHSGTENKSLLSTIAGDYDRFNFAMEGVMSFNFEQKDDLLERKVRMRIAQGNYKYLARDEVHPWQIYVMDEVCEDEEYETDRHELRCNTSKLALKALKGEHYTELKVSPYPY